MSSKNKRCIRCGRHTIRPGDRHRICWTCRHGKSAGAFSSREMVDDDFARWLYDRYHAVKKPCLCCPPGKRP